MVILGILGPDPLGNIPLQGNPRSRILSMLAEKTPSGIRRWNIRRPSIVWPALVVFVLLRTTWGYTDDPDRSNAISGRITDALSAEPLPHCNVFLANTTLGCVTDLEGKFLLRDIPEGRYQLVANRVGYQPWVIDIELPADRGRSWLIRLQQKPIEVGEVMATARVPREWQAQLARFKRAFLGETRNAGHCTIDNPEVLRFESDALQSDLTAFCDSSLHITNRALGYHLDIVLSSFHWGGQEGYYQVYPRFEPLTPQDAREAKQWQENRTQAWDGSFRHFISALARGEAEKEGFELFIRDLSQNSRNPGERLFSDSLIEIAAGMTTKLRFSGLLEVHYHSGEISMIKLNQNFVLIEGNGDVYPPLSIVLYGYWAQQRIADTLPLDYDGKAPLP